MSGTAAFDPEVAKAEIKAFALKGGALVAGVADAGAFSDEAEGTRPGDLLPGAKCVLVLGGAQPRAGDWRSPNHEHMESMGTSERIQSLALRVAKAVEDRYGYYAVYVPPGVNRGNRAFLRLERAALLSGCGSASLAGPVLHETFGFMFYAAVVTTLPLSGDVPAAPACPAPECLQMWDARGTTPCMDVCPIDRGGCLGGRIEGGKVVERRFDRARCATRVHTHWVPGFQKVLEATLNEADPERRKMMLYGSFFTRALWSITYAAQSQAQCFECMRVCPVGKDHRTRK